MLENEKRDHVGLKQTWQRANDQFLESQRLQIIEMRCMQSVLSEEQQRQILAIQKQEEEEENERRRQLQQIDRSQGDGAFSSVIHSFWRIPNNPSHWFFR